MHPTSFTTKPAIHTLLIFVACIVFSPGLDGPFLFDDFQNIVNNKSLQITSLSFSNLAQATFSHSAGPLGRPLANLTFALNAYYFELNPFAFKAVNLFIHLLTMSAVFMLIRKLVTESQFTQDTTPNQRLYIAFFITAVWGLNPTAIDNVLYVVQRMNLLSALFVAWGCVYYIHIRKQSANYNLTKTIIALITLIIFIILAALSKENGLLLPAFLLVIELFAFRLLVRNQQQRRFINYAAILLIAIPASAIIVYILSNPAFISGGYSSRTFDLTQRLLTEPRILLQYMHGQFVPLSSSLGVFHDDITVSTGFFQPIGTFFSIISIIAATALGLFLRNKHPYLIFGIAWFLVGHMMESTVFALELYFLHRNYLPSLGPIIILVVTLSTVCGGLQQRKFTAIVGSYLLALIIFSLIRANIWSDEYSLYSNAIHMHPQSARANYELGNWYIKNVDLTNNKQAAIDTKRLFTQSINSNNQSIHGHFGLILLDSAIPIGNLDGLISDMEYRLANRTFKSSNIDLLQGLSLCVTDGICNLPQNSIDRLYNAVLQNQTTTQRARAVLESDYAGFVLNYHKDHKKALLLFYKATKTDPNNFSIQNQLIRLLGITGNIKSATQALYLLKQSPNAFKNHNQINDLEIFLLQHSKDTK